MNPNPWTDIYNFLRAPGWPTPAFWVLLAASALVALYAWAAVPEQRRFGHFCNWLFRLAIGSMWWQQTLWKLPPYYTDHPDKPFGATGLAYWMGLLGKHAAVPAQADFVNHIVLPHFFLFAPAVYALETLTAVSLLLGLFVRLMGLVGALQIINLWLGLYSAPGEWPWTYFFLIVLQLIFALHRYGRSLGLDAVIAARSSAAGGRRGFMRSLIDAAT
ncbi:MAG TPA: hypothetical protein VM755_18265 [Stellaceae bacterium]|nr:hypothetical protein [Stellaceae bacterium]